MNSMDRAVLSRSTMRRRIGRRSIAAPGTLLIHPHVAKQLGIDAEKLHCITKDVGGGFGMKIFVYPEPIICAWASRKLKRTVKYTPERGEAFMTDTQGRDNISKVRAALDANGVMTGMEVTFRQSWRLPHLRAVHPDRRGRRMLSGVYAVPKIYVNVKGVVTNTTPVDATEVPPAGGRLHH